MDQRIFSLGQVAESVGVQRYKIAYCHATNKVPEPSLRFCGKRAYTAHDVRRIAAHFGVEVDFESIPEEPKEG